MYCEISNGNRKGNELATLLNVSWLLADQFEALTHCSSILREKMTEACVLDRQSEQRPFV